MRRGLFAFLAWGQLSWLIIHSPTFCTYRIIRFCLYSNTKVVPQCMVKLVRPIKLFSFPYYDCDCTYYKKCFSWACASYKIFLCQIMLLLVHTIKFSTILCLCWCLLRKFSFIPHSICACTYNPISYATIVCSCYPSYVCCTMFLANAFLVHMIIPGLCFCLSGPSLTTLRLSWQLIVHNKKLYNRPIVLCISVFLSIYFILFLGVILIPDLLRYDKGIFSG